MKRIGLVMILSAILSFTITAQFTLASDNGSNYSGTWENGNNFGTGFNAWSINTNDYTGSFIGNPSGDGMGTTGIGTTAFGLYSWGTTYINAYRTIIGGLEIGDEFSFYWAMNYDANSGAKGIDFISSNSTVFNINNSSNSTITTTNGNANTDYGTEPMLITLTRTSGSSYSFTMTSRSGGATYSTTINTTSSIDEIGLYSGDQQSGDDQRNIYFNNFTIINNGNFEISSGSSETYTKTLSGASSLSKSGSGTLILTADNTYTGTTTVSAGTLEIQGSIESSAVTVQSGATLKINGDNVTVASLTVDNGGTVEIEAGKSLTVIGAFSNSGTFTIKSDATGTGSLIVNGTSTGNITAERYVDEVASKGYTWHYISSPVEGQSFSTDWMTNNSILFNDPAYQLYKFSEEQNYWIYYGYTGSEPEDFGDASFVEARGYSATRTSAGTLSFTGTVRTSDATYSATYNAEKGDGWNLVGNPFTSSLAITYDASTTDKFLTNTTNLSLLDDNYTALYVWDENSGYTYGEDDYKVIGSPVTGSYSTINQDYIQPGQAFMVKVSSAGSLQFTENMQAHTSVDFYKEEKEVWPSIELTVKNDDLYNSTAIGFNGNMTTGLDRSYDVGKLKGNPNIALYTRLVDDNGTDFAIQALSDNNIENNVIPIGIDISEENLLEFSANQTNLNMDIYLEDRLLNTSVNLSKENYSAIISNSGIGRFYLHFSPVGINETTNINTIQVYSTINSVNIINNHNLAGDVKIVNIMGQTLSTTQLSGNTQQSINIEAPTGVYIVNISLEDGSSISQKVILSK